MLFTVKALSQYSPWYNAPGQSLVWCIKSFSLSFFFKLLLEVNNVPDLSAGITCSFGQQAQVEGHVNGNRVMCLSPAGKEVPQILEGQGEPRHPVSKQGNKNKVLYTTLNEHSLNTHIDVDANVR